MPNDLPNGRDAEHDGNTPREPGRRPADDVNDPEHYRTSAASRAHGTHGRGGDEELLADEQATDTGDNPQLRRAGGGGDQAPDPNKFRENSPGNMGGAGWGSESVGGSVVDRRPDDSRG